MDTPEAGVPIKVLIVGDHPHAGKVGTLTQKVIRFPWGAEAARHRLRGHRDRRRLGERRRVVVGRGRAVGLRAGCRRKYLRCRGFGGGRMVEEVRLVLPKLCAVRRVGPERL